jgi:hypothetical protein
MHAELEQAIDTDGIRKLCEIDEIARFIFEYLADRQRNHAEQTVNNLLRALKRRGMEISNKQAIEFFKALEGFGCGRLLYGRRGYSTRFVWDVRMSSVGQFAIGQLDTVEELNEDDVADFEADDLISHTFNLRRI